MIRRFLRMFRGVSGNGKITSDAVINAFYVPEGKRKDLGVKVAIRKALEKGKGG